jgi:murein DD-endopeptidase MepM/ murein hydrolase activator NlpD
MHALIAATLAAAALAGGAGAAAVPGKSVTAAVPAEPFPAAAPPVGPRSELGWPLPGNAVVTRPFEAPDQPYGPGHRGVDLAGYPGEPVLAAGAGVVAFAGLVAGVAVVSIDHPSGLRTTYEPVQPTVEVGLAVAAGQQVGVLAAGHPGCPAAACLHWGVRRGAEYLDPLWLLAAGHVRLLPTG